MWISPQAAWSGVTGPSGSGKSTLVFEVLAKGRADTQKNRVLGKEQFNRVVEIGKASNFQDEAIECGHLY